MTSPWLSEEFAPEATPPTDITATGTINDLPMTDGLGGRVSAIRFTGAAPRVAGIVPFPDVDGARLHVVAIGGPLVLVNDSASSTATNRILTGSGADVTVPQGTAAWLLYDETAQRWRVTVAPTITSPRIDDAVLAYAGATPTSSAGIAGPRVVGSSTFDGGDPVAKGYSFSAIYSSTTSSTTTIALATISLAPGEGFTLDAKISAKTSSTLGRYKRAFAYQRVGTAAPAIVGALETGTDVGSGGTLAVAVSGNNVVLNVTPADANNRVWLVELSIHRMPAVA